MTISKDKITLIKNSHLDETMSNLDKLLKEKNISQAELARKLKRDPATINTVSYTHLTLPTNREV